MTYIKYLNINQISKHIKSGLVKKDFKILCDIKFLYIIEFENFLLVI